MTNLARNASESQSTVCLQSVIGDEFTLCGTNTDNEDYDFTETKMAISCSRCIEEINNCRQAILLPEFSCADGC